MSSIPAVVSPHEPPTTRTGDGLAGPASAEPSGSAGRLVVCDLTQSYSPTGGGIRTYLHAKRQWLGRAGIRHVLIVPGSADRVVEEGGHATHFVASPPVPGSPGYRLLLRSGRVLHLLHRERPDVVECLDAYNLPWTALAYRRRAPGAVVVGGYRTDFPAAYVEPIVRGLWGWAPGGRRLAASARRAAERYAAALYRRMDAVYTLSETAARRLEARGVGPVEVLPLGVDVDLFHPSRRDIGVRRALGVGDGAPLLAYAGRLDREKRPLELVEALAQLPGPLGAHLLLVGHGPHRQEALDRAGALGLAGRVHAPGFVDDRERLAALLASSDLYVSAMPHETFGVSVIEAQACGLPVVGVASGAMPDRVPPGLGRLAPPGDPSALAAAVLGQLEDGLGRASALARVHVEARFSWEATFRPVLALYRAARDARGARTA